MVIHPFVLLSLRRTWVEPNGGEAGDLGRFVCELVAIDEGLVEGEVLRLLVILRERDEGELHGDALGASLRFTHSTARTAAS